MSTLERAVAEGRCPMSTCSAARAERARRPWRASSPRRCCAEGAEAARASARVGLQMACGTCPECEASPPARTRTSTSSTGEPHRRQTTCAKETIGCGELRPGAPRLQGLHHRRGPDAPGGRVNALLKTLEEPPAMSCSCCAPPIHRRPQTILSRCRASTSTASRTRTSSAGCAGDVPASRRASPRTTRRARDGGAPCPRRHVDALSTLEQLSASGRLRAASTTRGRFWARSPHGALRLRLRDFNHARRGGAVRPGAHTQVEGGSDLMEFTRDAVAHVRDVYTACVAGTVRSCSTARPRRSRPWWRRRACSRAPTASPAS